MLAAPQTADAVLMVRPAAFGFDPEAASTNAFQARPHAGTDVATAARAEFDGLVRALRAEGIAVCVADDVTPPERPDAVFPNNWISFHPDGTVVLYPMQPPRRRLERRAELIDLVRAELGFVPSRRLDLSTHERDGRFLEGTGSLVLDHAQRIAHACLSPRTDRALVESWCEQLGYEPNCFTARDAAGRPWYHTNVMLAIGTDFAVVGAESIDASDRARVLDALARGGRELVEIDQAAVAAFAGNVLELASWDEALGDIRVLVTSARARAAFTAGQWSRLCGCVDSTIVAPVPTIETVGGGSVRCMLAEVFRAARPCA